MVKIGDLLIPKDKQLTLFASVHGTQCAGNARFLFEYILNNRPDLRAWFYFRQAEHKALAESSLSPSLHALWLFLRAQTIFITHGPDDFHPYYASSRKTVVHLWHGVPMRGLGLLDRSRTPKQRSILARTNQTISRIVMPSRESAMRWCSCVAVGLDKALYAGQPRNDFLLQKERPLLPESARKAIGSGSKVVLYAPTWRPNGPVRWFPFDDFNPAQLELFLEENDLRLLLRGHATEKGSAGKFLSGRVVDFSSDVLGDVNLALPYIDGLITDYSSLFYDYLLLDRPVIFLHYDYDFYNDYYGFLFDDPEYWFPGPKPQTFDEFKEALLSVGIETDVYRDKRRSVSKSINACQTANSGPQILGALGL
jgi:CDP-glycerol glycerophosphotransferase (TagB/SpsB family)